MKSVESEIVANTVTDIAQRELMWPVLGWLQKNFYPSSEKQESLKRWKKQGKTLSECPQCEAEMHTTWSAFSGVIFLVHLTLGAGGSPPKSCFWDQKDVGHGHGHSPWVTVIAQVLASPDQQRQGALASPSPSPVGSTWDELSVGGFPPSLTLTWKY